MRAMDESAEVSQLRARIAELEQQLATATVAGTPPSQPVAGSAWRAAVAGLCIVLGCVLAPVSVASVWVHNILADTDMYVETVAPIAEQPSVQAALADKITTEVVNRLDLEQVTSEALTSLSELEEMPPRVAATLPSLAVPISSGIESFARDQVDRVLASSQFATVWAEVNRIAHEQVLRLLTGEQGGAVSAQGDTITLNLGPVIDQVTQQMVDAGFTLAGNLPSVDYQFTLVQSDAVTKAQSAYQLLDVLGTWLPFVSLGLIAAGVLLARDRWRALLRAALGVTLGMVVLGAGLAFARSAYVTTTPADVLTSEAAGDVFDILVRFLRTTLRAVGVLGLVVALAAYLSGRSPQAVRARAGMQRGLARVRRRGAEATGWDIGPVGTWVTAHQRALRIVVVSLGALVLLLWSEPTVWVVLWTVVIVAVALAIVQLLSAPVGATSSVTTTAPQG
jgi:hypothetical protein